MERITKFFIFLFLISLINCSTSRNKMCTTFIEKNHDKYNVNIGLVGWGEEYAIGFKEVINKNQRRYIMYTYLCTYQSMDMNRVDFTIDMNKYSFNAIANKQNPADEDYITEYAYFDTNADFLVNLAEAQTVIITIGGIERQQEFLLDSKEILKIKDFYEITSREKKYSSNTVAIQHIN